MTKILEIADAVAESLSGLNAKVEFFPEFTLRELEDLKVCVVPLAEEYKQISRQTHETVLKVQVGFLKRATEDDLENLLRQVEEIGLGFLNRKFADAVCIAVSYNPIYLPEHLRERNQFTSIIELSFKTFHV